MILEGPINLWPDLILAEGKKRARSVNSFLIYTRRVMYFISVCNDTTKAAVTLSCNIVIMPFTFVKREKKWDGRTMIYTLGDQHERAVQRVITKAKKKKDEKKISS